MLKTPTFSLSWSCFLSLQTLKTSGLNNQCFAEPIRNDEGEES